MLCQQRNQTLFQVLRSQRNNLAHLTTLWQHSFSLLSAQYSQSICTLCLSTMRIKSEALEVESRDFGMSQHHEDQFRGLGGRI